MSGWGNYAAVLAGMVMMMTGSSGLFVVGALLMLAGLGFQDD